MVVLKLLLLQGPGGENVETTDSMASPGSSCRLVEHPGWYCGQNAQLCSSLSWSCTLKMEQRMEGKETGKEAEKCA